MPVTLAEGECFYSCFEFSQTLTSVTKIFHKLGKKVFYFFYKINAQEISCQCFQRLIVNVFQPIRARIVSRLFYEYYSYTVAE